MKLWIFPEGTRRGDGKIHNFKKGGFHMALSEQIPILPIVFSYYNFLDHKKKYFNEGKVQKIFSTWSGFVHNIEIKS